MRSYIVQSGVWDSYTFHSSNVDTLATCTQKLLGNKVQRSHRLVSDQVLRRDRYERLLHRTDTSRCSQSTSLHMGMPCSKGNSQASCIVCSFVVQSCFPGRYLRKKAVCEKKSSLQKKIMIKRQFTKSL